MSKINFKQLISNVRENLFVCVAIAICSAVVVCTSSVAVSVKGVADKYFAEKSTADIIMNSDAGFSAQDVELVREQTSADIIGVFYTDCRYSFGNSNAPIRVFSVDGNLDVESIISGKAIEANNECIAVKSKADTKLSVGDRITVESDKLNNVEFTVVGIAYIDSPDFENSILVSNSVFTTNSYNRLLLSCSFLRRAGYNTYSERYNRAVSDIITRLDSIATNRLDEIKAGSYDYRLLDLARYDKDLSEKVELIYSKKDELENTNKELAAVKNYIDQTEQLISEKSEQLSISAETIYATIGAELKAHEEKLKEVSALKSKLDAMEEECSKLEEQLNEQTAHVNDAKTALDAIANKQSADYAAAKNNYDEASKKQSEIKNSLDKKKAECNKKKSEYDLEYAKYEAAYSASKENYDKLISDTGISGEEITQMTLMNLTARAEYNQKLEQYNVEFSKMQQAQSEVVQSVKALYSSYAKLWYLSGRDSINEFNSFGDIAYVFELISQIACFVLTVVIAYFAMSRFKTRPSEVVRKLGFNIALFKQNWVIAITVAVAGYVIGFVLGYIISVVVQAALSIFTLLPFTVSAVDLLSAVLCLGMCIVGMIIPLSLHCLKKSAN